MRKGSKPAVRISGSLANGLIATGRRFDVRGIGNGWFGYPSQGSPASTPGFPTGKIPAGSITLCYTVPRKTKGIGNESSLWQKKTPQILRFSQGPCGARPRTDYFRSGACKKEKP